MKINQNSWYVIKSGDTLSSIAKSALLPDWQTIYNHPENKTFRDNNPDPNTISPGQSIWIPAVLKKSTGNSRVIIQKQKGPCCIADAHMHIQSGRVGTLPFALGQKRAVFVVREKTLDIPYGKLLEIFKREYLDKNVVDFYQKKYQPFIYLLTSHTDVFSEKIKEFSSDITERKKAVQKLIFNNALSLCRLIQKVSITYDKNSDHAEKVVIDYVADNMRIIDKMIENGELITNDVAKVIEMTRRSADDASDELIKKADLMTGMSISIATYILDFQLDYFSGLCNIGKVLLGSLKNDLKKMVDNVLDLFSKILTIGKDALRYITQEIIQIIMNSAEMVSEIAEKKFSKAENVANALNSQLAELAQLLDKMYVIGMGDFFAIQKEKTYAIADRAVKGNLSSMQAIAQQQGVDIGSIFAPIIAMPMDLDFAHLDRFESDFEKAKVYRYTKKRYRIDYKITVKNDSGESIQTVESRYVPPETSLFTISKLQKNETVDVEEGDFYYFHSRLSGVQTGKLLWVHPTEFKAYEYWSIQRKHTIVSVNRHPWRIIPLYHFEPRRYSGNCEDAFQYIMDKNSKSGSTSEPRVFAGVKIYPNLGYKPLDPRLPSLKTLYEKCIKNDIPVLSHGSPNGAINHDRPLYLEYDRSKNTAVTVPVKDLDNLKHLDKEEFYFMQEYASPHAWEKVLEKYPQLKLCIAHFGGSDNRPDSTDKIVKPLSGWNVPIDPAGPAKGAWDKQYWNQKIISMMQEYNNLYTDLSCQNKNNFIDQLPNAIIRWPDLRKRIMFGTDWYMTEIDELDYKSFTEQLKDGIDFVDSKVRASGKIPNNDPTLWQWFSEINPFRFYRFDKIAKEYTAELCRSIKIDPKMLTKNKDANISSAIKQKPLIYSIAKKLNKIGELPDAVTSD